jgi:ferredoxin
MSDARHIVTLEPQGWRFEAGPGTTLMEAARQAGIVLPSSCRNGTCRTCMSRMLRGEVSYRIEWPGLLREEKQEGWILPCVAVAASDLVIEAPAARKVADAGT